MPGNASACKSNRGASSLGISDHASYPRYLHKVANDYRGRDGIIDLRPEVAEHWRKNGTWLEPPFFLDRALLKPNSNGLHLIEGHTRVGTLLGAMKYQFVKVAKLHTIFLACRK
jgi:hypothetical protein